MPAALLIGAGISAATGLIGANKQANAAKDAARTQSQSADRAIALQRDIYQSQLGLMQPYIHGGTQAFDSMMRQYGDAGRPMANYQPMPSGLMQGRQGRAQPPMGGGLMGGAPRAGGGQVKLQAPNGEVQIVPAAHAQHYIGLGAKPLGGLA